LNLRYIAEFNTAARLIQPGSFLENVIIWTRQW
jgi:hypothetical protein